jgi:SAM-dependent methyltransferase
MLVLRQQVDLTVPVRLLHVAPERALERYFAAIPTVDYLSADLHSRRAMVSFDVTAIPFAEGSFDAIICNHVLEHVPDDSQALRELRRVCRPGGWAILQVPVDPNLESTWEDLTVASSRERQRLFGQSDHVRSYGRDYRERLQQAGWQVTMVDISSRLGPEAARMHGLTSTHDKYIYFCTNPLE